MSRNYIYIYLSLVGSLLIAPSSFAEIKSASTLPRGTIIEAADLDLSQASTVQVKLAQNDIIGKEVARTIYAGRRITQKDVTAPKIVKRNARVPIVYRSGRLEIRSIGRALEEGGIGDTIKLMNVDSKEILFGTITANAEIEVN